MQEIKEIKPCGRNMKKVTIKEGVPKNRAEMEKHGRKFGDKLDHKQIEPLIKRIIVRSNLRSGSVFAEGSKHEKKKVSILTTQ